MSWHPSIKCVELRHSSTPLHEGEKRISSQLVNFLLIHPSKTRSKAVHENFWGLQRCKNYNYKCDYERRCISKSWSTAAMRGGMATAHQSWKTVTELLRKQVGIAKNNVMFRPKQGSTFRKASSRNMTIAYVSTRHREIKNYCLHPEAAPKCLLRIVTEIWSRQWI